MRVRITTVTAERLSPVGLGDCDRAHGVVVAPATAGAAVAVGSSATTSRRSDPRGVNRPRPELR